jgi:hypothetical protein
LMVEERRGRGGRNTPSGGVDQNDLLITTKTIKHEQRKGPHDTGKTRITWIVDANRRW